MGQSPHSFHFLCFQLYVYFFEAKAKLNTIISKFEEVLQTKDDIDVLVLLPSKIIYDSSINKVKCFGSFLQVFV